MFKKKEFIPFILLVAGIFLATVFHAGSAYLASDVLGQLDSNDQPVFNTSSTNNGSSTPNNRGLSNAQYVELDSVNHRLFVNDRGNNRILVFNLDTNNNLLDRVADNVLGQPDFTTSTATTTQSGLSTPFEIAYDSVDNRLFVTDYSNHRVVVYDTASIVDGENAVNVLGQPNFTTSTVAVTQSGVNGPMGLAYDSVNRRLFVGQDGGRRVTVFDVSPATITNGQNASFVLGQQDFVSNTGQTTQNGMNTTVGVLDYDAANSRLFVGENGNKRVLVFDVSPGTIANGMNASFVLGQTNFTSNTSTVTQNGITGVQGLAYDSVHSRLFVSRASENRILVFDVPPGGITNGEDAVSILCQDNFTSSTSTTSQSGCVSSGGSDYDASNNRLYIVNPTGNRVMIFNIMTLTTPTLSVGSKGAGDYNQSLGPVHTQGTTTYSIATGTLPTGLGISTTTGVITGTPTTPGAYTFTARASSDTGIPVPFIHDKQYTIVIQPPTGGGGNVAHYLPPQTFIPPSNVSLVLNGGATSTVSRIVSVFVNATFPPASPDAPYSMTPTAVLSNSDIAPSAFIPPQLHTSTLRWDLCATYGGYGPPDNPCREGLHIVSAKVYSPWNVASDVVTSSIVYAPPGAAPVSVYTSPLSRTESGTYESAPSPSSPSLPTDQEETPGLVRGKDFAGITRWLYQGLTGDDVLLLQRFLNQRGYLIGEQNGVFGPLTRAAVVQFQEAYFNEILAPRFWRGTGIFATSTRGFVMRNY